MVLTDQASNETSTEMEEERGDKLDPVEGRPEANRSRPAYFTFLSPVPIEWKILGSGPTAPRLPLRFQSYPRANPYNSYNNLFGVSSNETESIPGTAQHSEDFDHEDRAETTQSTVLQPYHQRLVWI